MRKLYTSDRKYRTLLSKWKRAICACINIPIPCVYNMYNATDLHRDKIIYIKYRTVIVYIYILYYRYDRIV